MNARISRLPNFARACGRVLVGVNPQFGSGAWMWLRKVPHPVLDGQQLEANRPFPLMVEERGLKQRRYGLFLVSVGPPKVGNRRGLSHHCRMCGSDLSVPIEGSTSGSTRWTRIMSPQHGSQPSRRTLRAGWLAPPDILTVAASRRPLNLCEEGAMTARIREFLRSRRDDGPCLVVDLDVVRDNYMQFFPCSAGYPRFLRGEGEPGAGIAAASGGPRFLLRHSIRRRDGDGTRDRRHG